jgi:H+-translocating NAD(P) transhydrogenase subunit alpha
MIELLKEYIGYFFVYKYLFFSILFAIFYGITVSSKLPHTLIPTMNSFYTTLHGSVVITGITAIGTSTNEDYLFMILGFISIVVGMINLVGGLLLSDRLSSNNSNNLPNKIK